MPGNPARLALGPLATEEQVDRLSKQMDLDRPLPVQYYIWLKAVLHGDFGRSLVTRRSVTQDLAKFLPATMELAFFSFLISLVIGQLLGILAGQYQNSWFDNVARVISYLGIVTPPFVFAIIFLLVFSYVLGFAPSVGRLSFGTTPPPNITGFIVLDGLISGHLAAVFDALKHLFLPAISLAMGSLAQETRITRSSISDNLRKDYISAHVAYGISKQRIMFKYLLKPSILPTVAIMGLDFASLLSNAFLVEMVFMWPGFSKYGIQAMLNKDLNAIIAVILILGVTFVTINILVDVIVMSLDPRITFKKGLS